MSLFHRIVQLMLRVPALQKIRIFFYFYDTFLLRFIPKPKRKNKKQENLERPEKKKVLVVFTHALGDAVIFYGSISYIFQLYPKEEYEVFLTCHKEYEELFKSQFHGIVPIDYRRANISLKYRITFLKRMRGEYYDIAIDPIGCEECSPNVYVMNAVCADKKIGILPKQDKKYQCPKWIRNNIYDVLLEEGKNVHKTKHYAKVWSVLANQDFKPLIAQLPVGKTKLLPAHFFVVYPSASIPVKRWPAERFGKIAQRIYQEKKWHLVVCGTEQDREVTEQFLNFAADIPVCNLLGKTTVLELVEVIGRSQMVLTNDTSIYHIAVGTGRKTCVVSGGYVYDLFLNYLSIGYELKSDIRIAIHKRSCMNCSNECIYKVETVYPCVLENTVEEVWEKVSLLISEKEE
ncbi:hypothetical protein D5281_05515 [bacterium 1xD42-62]|uniref:Glycosyltransferase family 9 protein n=1 Tax=Parablautia muri TaxID=2320879 RepID=A0A9X5BE70_9FIRM|nr:hypothetical protein [Parablautia muri]